MRQTETKSLTAIFSFICRLIDYVVRVKPLQTTLKIAGISALQSLNYRWNPQAHIKSPCALNRGFFVSLTSD